MEQEQEPDAAINLMSGSTRQRLAALSRALLRLHKALLEGERAAYEQANGRTVSGGELLQLLIRHESFAWLRPFSTLVVQIDETLDAKEPVTEQIGGALLQQVRLLLNPSEGSEGSRGRYNQALQQNPAAILAHAEATRLLPPAEQSGSLTV